MSKITADERNSLFMVEAACKVGVTANCAIRRGRSAGSPAIWTVLDGLVSVFDSGFLGRGLLSCALACLALPSLLGVRTCSQRARSLQPER